MLVVLLILLTNVLADSDEDKYVDLLPEEEKQQFIEKVARRILKDVQSQETGKGIQSEELSDEQLTKHNEFVKAILKQEADFAKRRKTELTKSADDKSTSEEKDNLGVKPLEKEKLAIGDDTDLERVDLTLRNDRREIAVIDESSTFHNDYIKVEIVTDPAPKIKRSVPIKTGSESSESDEFTSEEKIEPKTEKNTEVIITTEKYENLKSTIANNDIVTTTEKVETTTAATNSNNESLLNIKLDTNNTEIKTNISKNEDNNSTEKIESTTLDNEGIGQAESKNYGSSESEEEELQVKGISEQTRRYNENSNETSKTKTKSDIIDNTTETIGVKSSENMTDEFKTLTTTGMEELTNITNKDNTTTEDIPTTTNEAFTDLSSSTNIIEDIEREPDTTTEYPLNTLTSTLTDEGTTDAITETTSYSSTTEILTTTTEIPTTTTETETSKDFTTTTTESTTNITTENCCKEEKIVVKHYTWEPVNKSVDSVTPTSSGKKESHISNSKLPIETKKIKTKKHAITKDTTTTQKIDLDEDSMEPTTKKNKPIPRIQKIDTVIKLPKNILDTAIVAEKKTKHVKNNLSVDKNFIELEKLYYDNNYKVKLGDKYQVYEIPTNVSPFIEEEQVMTEEPYYVPIYNYAPNNAYFNPVNRLGPNPEDVSLDDIGAFSVVEENNSDQELKDKVKAKNYEDSRIVFDIKRKKFGSKQKVPHSIHKAPQQNGSYEKKRGNVNPEEYLDSDYYFGRVRKVFERRDNNFDQFPNSNEHDHPTHSIRELSLKDHVRAVRNILFHQKKFGPPERLRIGHMLRQKESIRNKPNKLLIKKVDSVTRNGSTTNGSTTYDSTTNDSTNKEDNVKDRVKDIAIDYYFGRIRPTAIFTAELNEAEDKHLQKVGYIQNQNNTKELYVMDEFFKDNVVKYLTEIQTKTDTYVKADLMSATPHTITRVTSVSTPKQVRNETVTRFRNEEMKRNAEIMKHFMKNQTKNKDLKESEKKDLLKMGSEDKNNTHKDKISAVRIEKKSIMNDKSNSTKNHELNLRLNRRNDVVKVGVYVQVLKDMISLDNKALKQYDWLGTSVDIQGSLQKLFDVIYFVANEDTVHPGDLEILKYVLFLHKLATEIIQANDFGSKLRKKLALPRNKKKEKHRMLKEKGLINRVWLYLRREVPEINEDKALKNLDQFLMDIEDGLYNLHDAIKNIAKITKFKNQHWYQNLKELYLNTDEKHVLELLLHMTVSRLFDLVEDSARSGLEDDYVKYMKRNKKIAKRTLEEMLFAIQILEEINKIVD